MQIETLLADPVMVFGAAFVGLGLLALVGQTLMSSSRRTKTAKSPISLVSSDYPRTMAAAPKPRLEMPPMPAQDPEVVAAPVEAPKPARPSDPLAEQRRFFSTLGAGLAASDEGASATLAALQSNLSAEVFMDRMALAAKGWRPTGFGAGGRDLLLRADGTPPDAIASQVLDGYEQLSQGHAKAALAAFLGGIEAANAAAAEDGGNAWPHAWSAYAWRGLALIAEESGDVQATLAGLKVAYQSMVNAYEVAHSVG